MYRQLIGLLIDLGLHELWYLICTGLSSRFGMLVFFTNPSLIEFQATYLVLFCLFSITEGLEWLWMESLLNNIQLMLEFLKEPFSGQGPTLFQLYINDLPDYTICNITIYADDTTLCFKCDQAFWSVARTTSLVKFKFQVNVVIDFGVMQFVYKGFD